MYRSISFERPSVHYAHLKKVYCLPYIQGLRVRLGYSPKGGTIRVNVSARNTKLAGSTIYQKHKHAWDLKPDGSSNIQQTSIKSLIRLRDATLI